MPKVARGRYVGQGAVLAPTDRTVSRLFAATRFEAQAASGGLSIMTHTQIASGYMHRCDAAALVVGPTGLVYDPRPPREKRRLDRGRATHDDRLPAAGAPRT